MEENFEKSCACRGANLGKFIQPIILNILNKDNCNGYQIIKKMESYSTFLDAKPDPTGIYRYLKAMSDKNLIEKDDSSEEYSITSHGIDCLNNWKVTLKNYCETITNLLNQIN